MVSTFAHPVVQERRLPLNPEDLDEIAYAVLVHAGSDATFEEIAAAVREQIKDARRRRECLYRDDAG